MTADEERTKYHDVPEEEVGGGERGEEVKRMREQR